MSRALDNQIVVVTGAARRLGAAIALAAAREGAAIVLNYRSSRSDAEVTAAAIADHGVPVQLVAADVAEPVGATRLLDQALERFGRIDALVANASTFHRTPLASLTFDQWQEGVTNNLHVAALPAITIGRWMKSRGSGAIVALADSAGDRPWLDYLPYSVGKAGVIALTKGLAKELAPEVRVNAVVPGPMLFPEGADAATQERERNRTLLKRTGNPDHIASAVLFLLTHDYITGAVLPVDGGRGLA